MRIYEPLVLLTGILTQILGTSITLDDEAQEHCKRYKMMCETGKVCAVQHFTVPKQISIPVCIPLSFVPAEYRPYVRNLICQLPPDPGRCSALYIRWYYNIHSQECSHFRYWGCNGNQNNFMSKDECETSCIATPSIKLFEGGQSALVQMKPSIMTAPVYKPAETNSYQALNTVRERYRVARHRSSKNNSDEGNTRKRRRLDKEKERRRRERRKEKKRRKKLRQRQRNLKRGKKNKKGKKKKRKNRTEVVDKTTPTPKHVATKDENEIAKETKEDIINEITTVGNKESEIQAEKDRKRKRKKRRNKDRKKRDRLRSRRHRPENKRFAALRSGLSGNRNFAPSDQNRPESSS